MPFTPFHMGPGILIKSVMQGSFSLMVFGWSQIVMDIQPLIGMLAGADRLHGFTHTYVGATLIAVVAALSGKHLSEWALVNVFAMKAAVAIRWWVAGLSALIGAYSHVILDSIMHSDVRPFFPFSETNGLHQAISVSALHDLCLYSGLVGAAIYFGVNRYLNRRPRSEKR